MESIKGYKTIIFNAVMTVGMLITVWTGIDTEADVQQITDSLEAILGSVTVIWGVGNVWLRAVTDSPVFRKK